MARLCERPTCGAVASFAYGFDVERRIVWLDALGDERFRAGALCRRHADRLTVPRGWWLEDRRTPDSLFEVDEPTSEAVPVEPAHAPKPRARRKKAAPEPVDEAPSAPEPDPPVVEAPDEEVPEPVATDVGDADDPGPFPDPTAVDVAEPWEGIEEGEPDHQWEPAFASVDPDPAVDASSTPLLAKAFGHDAPQPQPGPRRRPRRPRPAPEPSSEPSTEPTPADQGDPPPADPVD